MKQNAGNNNRIKLFLIEVHDEKLEVHRLQDRLDYLYTFTTPDDQRIVQVKRHLVMARKDLVRAEREYREVLREENERFKRLANA